MTEHGTILVRVTTSRAQIPVEGATVAITRPIPSGKHDLISLCSTNESGLIPPVPIPAPPAGESTSPGVNHPYATCDVWIEHSAFQTLRVEGVQIFTNVETVQDAELLPLAEHPESPNRPDVVNITTQPL